MPGNRFRGQDRTGIPTTGSCKIGQSRVDVDGKAQPLLHVLAFSIEAFIHLLQFLLTLTYSGKVFRNQGMQGL